MSGSQFGLTPASVAALTAAVAQLGADLDGQRAEFERQPTEFRYSPRGVEVSQWLDLVDNLCAAMDDIALTPGDQEKEERPPATGTVTGGSFMNGRNGDCQETGGAGAS